MKAEEQNRLPGKESSIVSWLDTLQQESWQLELLISGFAVFLLIGGYQPFADLDYKLGRLVLDTTNFRVVVVTYYVVRTAYLVLIFCLLIHVLLRGIWIAAIGLRYVSGGIEYDNLRYRPRYTEFLKKRIGSFDDYIEKLERYCSVIFSIAFLIIFCFISLVTYSLFTVGIQYLFGWISGQQWQGNGVFGGSWVGLICLVLGLIYFFDFVTLGLLKRSNWTAGVYYPVYRFMGWITLSNLYRPLYHNLVDHRFGRRLARLLPLFILTSLVIVSLDYVGEAYYPYYNYDGTHIIDADNYDREGASRIHQLRRPSLRSKYPLNDYIELFVPYLPVYNDPVISRENPELEVSRYVGVKLRGAFNFGQMYNQDVDYSKLLEAVGGLHRLSLDGEIVEEVRPRFHRHAEREQSGLLYMVPTHELEIGEHLLKLETRYLAQDSMYWADYGGIYFYK